MQEDFAGEEEAGREDSVADPKEDAEGAANRELNQEQGAPHPVLL